MRIDAFNKVSELYRTSNTKSTSKTKSSGFSDKLELSQVGKDYQVAKQIVARTPDVRETKVQDIKQRMDAGVYNVKIEDVADKLLEHYSEQ